MKRKKLKFFFFPSSLPCTSCRNDSSGAYKEADGRKIDNRRIVVDVERGRTMKNWKPRRLGGGLGNTRAGGPEVNQRYSGRYSFAHPDFALRGTHHCPASLYLRLPRPGARLRAPAAWTVVFPAVRPTATASATGTATETATVTEIAIVTATEIATVIATESAIGIATVTGTAIETAIVTEIATVTATAIAIGTAIETVTVTVTETATATTKSTLPLF